MDIESGAGRVGAGKQGRSAWQQVLDLGCEASRYRVLGGSYYNLVHRARGVAQEAAAARLEMESPLTELFRHQRERGYLCGPTLGWEYERAFKIASDGIDPSKFFAVEYENAFITIRSLGIAGGDGEVKFNDANVDRLFECAAGDTESSYDRWLHDHYPVGGHFLLQRIDVVADEEYGALRLVAEDVHPCRGHLQFGDVRQELDQLAAFVKLFAHVRAIFTAKAPTAAELAQAAERATAILQRQGRSFMPSSGFCGWCRADVTAALSGTQEGACVTGCPLCGHTWCD